MEEKPNTGMSPLCIGILAHVCGESPKFTQAAFPVTAKATIEQIMTLEKEHKINVVTISNFYFREACVDVDNDNICDICERCQHNTTTTTFTPGQSTNGNFTYSIKCTATGCTISSTTWPYYGDMDGDEKVDETDVQFLKDNMDKLDELTEVQRFAADVDSSGKIDALDLFLLERVVDGSLEQKVLPVKPTLSYTEGDAENHYQVVTVNGTTFEQPYATGKHTFEDNKCTVCGAADPNYKPGVKTGDESNTALWVLVMASAAMLAAAVVVLPRKKHSR